MSDLLARARILRQHHRHEEAVAMLHQHLAQDPDDPTGHLELAITRMAMEDMLELALADIRRAVGLRPGEWFPLAVKARILCLLKRHVEGLKTTEAAISLNPDQVYAWNTKTIALADLGRLASAEQNARRACAMAPDNADAINLLAHVLRVQGKLAEALAESQRMLARDPDNAIAFTNSGLAALQRHEGAQAENHFKEALRLDPNSKRAKDGLKRAYHLRSRLYRALSGWSRIVARHRWIIPIQLVVVAALVLALNVAGRIGVVPALLLIMGGCYLLMVFCVSVAPGLARFLILRDPIARLSLGSWEKTEGIVIAALVFLGIGLVAVGPFLDRAYLLTAGLTLLAAAIPIARAFTYTWFWRGIAYYICGAIILFSGLASAAEIAATPPDNPYPPAVTAFLFVAGVVTALVVRRSTVTMSR